MSVPNFSFLACLEVARLVRLARLATVAKGGTNKFRMGGQALIGGWVGGLPLDGYGYGPPHPHTHLDIGQPWSNSLLDIESFGQVGGGHWSFRRCPVVQFPRLSLVTFQD